ncbi:coiled-coil domain-containing protein 148-like isoform X1 [Dermacentor albipictus]|uniref:coiled-coil domain-containing protein 148-like isoform X1 n=1 Tax=Dermacentor albipictus TaxID=60249 RepID=UPI0038FCF2EC
MISVKLGGQRRGERGYGMSLSTRRAGKKGEGKRGRRRAHLNVDRRSRSQAWLTRARVTHGCGRQLPPCIGHPERHSPQLLGLPAHLSEESATMEVEVKSNHSPVAGKASRKKRPTRKAARKSIVAATEEHRDEATPPRRDQTPDSQSSRGKQPGDSGAPLQPPRNKAASLMQQHRSVWRNEFQKLHDAEERLKNDIVDKLRYISSTGISSDDEAGQCLEDWIDYELGRTKFQDSADSRVEWFRRILACRLGFMDDQDGEEGGAQPSANSEAQMVADLREAQRETRQLTATLEQQFREADEEVARAFESSPLSNTRFTFSRNVEDDFQASWNGDERMRRPLLAELKQIDHKFESKIKDIDKAHKLEPHRPHQSPEHCALHELANWRAPGAEARAQWCNDWTPHGARHSPQLRLLSRGLRTCIHQRREEPADWTADDFAVVNHVLEQYPSNLGNRRALIMDWLRRHFKKRSILDISTYMTWCQNQRYHRDKVQSCLQEWERARVQWLAKAKQTATTRNGPGTGAASSGPPQRRRTMHHVALPPAPSLQKKPNRLPPIDPELKEQRAPRPRARVRIAPNPTTMSSSSAPHLGAVAGLDGVAAASAVGSKADQLRQAERQALEERNREWRLRSLSTVREIEVLRMRRKQSIVVAGVDDASEVQELAKVQRKLNLERVKFRQELAMKKQRDRLRVEQKKQEQVKLEKLQLQKTKRMQ